MDNLWDKLRVRVLDKGDIGPAWVSEQKSLLEIIDRAETLGADPSKAVDANITNLRDIIKEVRRALLNEDVVRCNELFELAGTKTSKELRIALGKYKPQKILCSKVVENGQKVIKVTLTPEQLDRIQMNTKPYFDFEIKD